MKRICCIKARETKSDVYYWDDEKGLICQQSPYSPHYIMTLLTRAQFRSIDDTRKLIKQLHMYQKVPLYLGENLLFFPTAGSRNLNCHWIRFDCLKSVSDVPSGTLLCFEWKNMQSNLVVDCDKRIIVKQIRRCRMIIQKIQSFQIQQVLKLD